MGCCATTCFFSLVGDNGGVLCSLGECTNTPQSDILQRHLSWTVLYSSSGIDSS